MVLDVIAALGASGLSAHRLELEITETVLLQDTEATVATLNQLRELGVRISMDDFGTGYSSLGYLRKFPFDKIKIDRSFIRDMADGPDSIAIVRAVTGLGSSLGIATTAEGVETEAQLAQLRSEGCTEVQGYLFTTPTQTNLPQPLVLEALVEVGDVFAVAVEQQRRPPLAGADHLLGRLAPARMRHLRIDVGPEAVFGRLQRLPVALRPLVGEGET